MPKRENWLWNDCRYEDIIDANNIPNQKTALSRKEISAFTNIKDCEDKLTEKEENIRRLRQENNSNSTAYNFGNRKPPGCDSRILGAMKDTVEELTQELRLAPELTRRDGERKQLICTRRTIEKPIKWAPNGGSDEPRTKLNETKPTKTTSASRVIDNHSDKGLWIPW